MTTFLMMMSISLMVASTLADDGANSVTYDPKDVTEVRVQVFDCDVPANHTVQAIDLTETGKCHTENVEEKFDEPEEVDVTQVMVDLPVAVKVYRCSLVLNKYLDWHGMSSYKYHGEHYIIDYQVHLPRDECVNAIRRRIIVCGQRLCGGRGSHRLRIPYGRDSTFHWVSRGSLHNLNAYPESFVKDVFVDNRDNVTLKEVKEEKVYAVEHSYLTVTLEEIDGSVDLLTNVITIPALPLQAEYDIMYVNNYRYGLVAWDRVPVDCRATIGIITKEKATVRKLKRVKDGAHPYSGSLVIIENSEEGRASGMILRDERHPCIKTHQCLQTNVPRLVACLGEDDVEGVSGIETKRAPNLLRMELQAGLTYVHFAAKVDAAELAQRIWASICLAFETLAHYARISLIDKSNYYSLQGMSLNTDKPLNVTQQSIVRGGATFLTNCTSRIGRLTATNKCTQQIGVVLLEEGGRTSPTLRFADAITKQLVAAPSISECSGNMPIMHKIEGTWHCLSPKHAICPERLRPAMLVPNVGRTRGIMLDDVRDIQLTLTVKQVEEVQKITRAQRLGPVIRDRLDVTVFGNSEFDQGPDTGTSFHLGMPLTGENISQIADLVSGRMFFLFKLLGQAYLNIFGVIMLINLAQYCLNTLCRIFYLWKANDYKIGPYLIKAIFAVLFSATLLPILILKEVGSAVDKQLKEDAERILPNNENYEECRQEQDVIREELRCLREAVIETAENGGQNWDLRGTLANTLAPADQLREERERRKKRQEEERKGFLELTEQVQGELRALQEPANRPQDHQGPSAPSGPEGGRNQGNGGGAPRP